MYRQGSTAGHGSESEKAQQWREGRLFLCSRVSEAFVGKRPGRCRQPAGEGCEETARYFPLLALSLGAVPGRGKAQGLWVKGQLKNPRGWRWGGPFILCLRHRFLHCALAWPQKLIRLSNFNLPCCSQTREWAGGPSAGGATKCWRSGDGDAHRNCLSF